MALTSFRIAKPIETLPAQAVASRTLLRATGLKKSFGGQVVLDSVDLELRQGEVVLLRGENGSGKTTLLNILTGSLEAEGGTISYLADGTPRAFQFPRRWWQDLNPLDRFAPEFVAREGMGRTWQDVRLFGSQSLRANIAAAESNHPGENPLLALACPRRASRYEAEISLAADAMLSRLGLAGREDSSADKISLGQSKRVAIARAVAAGAKILFLDEPLAGLDRAGIVDVLDLLRFLVRERDVTLVIVEHVFNQPHLDGLLTSNWLLAGGKLTVTCSTFDLRHSAIPAWSRPACFEVLAEAGEEIIDEHLSGGALLTRIRRPEFYKGSRRPVLELRNLVVNRGPRTVIGLDEQKEASGLSLALYEGEIALLQAPNGWGKSTLLACIAGLLDPVKGEILLDGSLLGDTNPWNRRSAGLMFVPASDNAFQSLTSHEMFRLAHANSSVLKVSPHKKISELSGGQRQRTALAASSSRAGCRIRLFDEPFSMLDLSAIREIVKYLLPQAFNSVLVALPSTSDSKASIS
jgi:ABC-type multidrug transport system ATPase subunit